MLRILKDCIWSGEILFSSFILWFLWSSRLGLSQGYCSPPSLLSSYILTPPPPSSLNSFVMAVPSFCLHSLPWQWISVAPCNWVLAGRWNSPSVHVFPSPCPFFILKLLFDCFFQFQPVLLLQEIAYNHLGTAIHNFTFILQSSYRNSLAL